MAEHAEPGACLEQDRLQWGDYFMAVARLTSRRSSFAWQNQVGACIVSPDKRVVSVGYNGALDQGEASGEPTDPEYKKLQGPAHVYHAEYNAIINKGAVDPKGCTIYVTLFPCHECAKLLVQSGIAKVVYAERKHKPKDDADRYELAARLFERAGVSLCEFKEGCRLALKLEKK